MSLDIKAPIGPFDSIEKFGHPWHGLVTGGVLSLPNGGSMSYPQPSGVNEYAGMTRVFGCGMPPTATTVEEAAAGNEWRNVATLSGASCQIYSKAIGAGAWIYRDPDGTRWRVTTTAEGRTPAQIEAGLEVTLTRFGDFGAVPAVHKYTVDDPSVGQSSPDIGPPPIGHLIDSSPDGGRGAIFSFDVERYRAESSQPAGFFEIRLSGPGAACDVTVVVLDSRAAVLGTTSGGIPYFPYVTTWVGTETTYEDSRVGYPTCSGKLKIIMTPVVLDEQPSSGHYEMRVDRPFVGRVEASIAGRVLARFYRADGTVGKITYDASYLADIDSPPGALADVTPEVVVWTNAGPVGGGCKINITTESERGYTVVCSSSSDETFTQAISVDGVVMSSETISSTWSAVERRSYLAEFGSSTQTRTCTPGGTGSASVLMSREPSVVIGLFLNPAYGYGEAFHSMEDRARLIGFEGDNAWVMEGGAIGALSLSPMRFAPLVWGFAVRAEAELRTSGEVLSSTSVVVCPAGAVAVTPVALDPAPWRANMAQLFGSYCPVTESAAISDQPVCYV